jgi:hypothetical protein
VNLTDAGSDRHGSIEPATRARGLREIVMRSAAAVLAMVAAALFAGHVEAFVYWTEGSVGTIGRANLDGNGKNLTFISGLNKPQGMAIDGTYLYWVTGLGNIARANLDGTGVNEGFIVGVFAVGLAVDSSYIYWTTTGHDRIGRANLNGTGINPSFITTVIAATGVTVDGTHIYWTNSGINAIGRADLSGLNANQTFITGAQNPQGLAVDGTYIYWVNANSGTIARANLNGTGANESFILAGKPEWIAVDSTYVWWTNAAPFYAIGRANLNGTGVSQILINTLSPAAGLAVNALVAPSPGPGPSSPTIMTLVDDVQGLGLPRGIERSLVAKLGAAQGSLDDGQILAACAGLNAFINEVRAQANHKLDGDDAADLIADAAAIRQLLACGQD